MVLAFLKNMLIEYLTNFFRVPTGDRHNIKGYGLGLSYAMQIVQQHDGTIKVAGNDKGGTTFTIIIPQA